MVRKAQEPHLVIGFFGSGDVAAEAVEAHLDDYLEASPSDVTFIVPIVKTMWNDTLAAVVEYAQAKNIPYEAVHDEVSAKARNLSKYLKGASKTHQVARIGQKILTRLNAEDKDNVLLAIAWDDDDEDLHALCGKAIESEITVRDLVDAAFEEVDFSQEDGPKPDDEAAPEPEPETSAAEPAGDDEWDPYTREELEGVIKKHEENPPEALKTLKQIADDYEIEVKPRTRATTLVDLILAHQDRVEKERAKADSVLKNVKIEVDYDKVAEIVREEIVALLEPDELLDKAFGEIVSTLEDIATNIEQIVANQAAMLDGDIDVTVEPEPEPDDEPEPAPAATATRRRRRI